VRLETIVRAVRWKPGAVEVEGPPRAGHFSAAAARAIITLPLGILQQSPNAPGAVRFAPALSMKRAALRGLVPSPVLKVSLLFSHGILG